MFEDVPLFLLPLPGPVPGLQQPSAAVKAVSSFYIISLTPLCHSLSSFKMAVCVFFVDWPLRWAGWMAAQDYIPTVCGLI